MPIARLTCRMMAMAAACIFTYAAVAQRAEPNQSFPSGDQRMRMQPGDACQRRTDDHRGVIKVDACGRWYCGRVDVNDITVLNPRFAEDMQCTWQLVDDRCKCVPS